MKPINYEGVDGVFMPDEEYQKLCTLVVERGELIDQLYAEIKKQDIIGIQHISSLIMEGAV